MNEKNEQYCLNDKFEDECGVFGIFSNDNDDVAANTYLGLYALQHRGEESAGIAYSFNGEIHCQKGMGLVSDVFTSEILTEMKGKAAIGHVRYSTTGSSMLANAQPLVVNSKLGSLAIAHNGNLVNAGVIRNLLEDGGVLFQTETDSEVILNLIARGANKGIEKAVFDAMQAIKGSYSIAILVHDRLIGIRDPHGIRPLCIGKLKDDYIISSESAAIDAIGGEFVRDVDPGEIVVIDKNGLHSLFVAEKTQLAICSFEYIYFARADSTIDGINVYTARYNAGIQLFVENPVKADVVIGVPDSGIPAAMGYSQASGIPFGIGFIKNKYVGRTFITPSQEMREKAVSVKLNALMPTVKGKKVVLIDDSIVRGTTSKRLIEQLRLKGATEVHFRVASPIVKFPCYFGIDTPYRKDLIGAERDLESIRAMIGADSIGYLSIEGLIKELGSVNNFCLGCFTGIYPLSAPFEKDKCCG